MRVDWARIIVACALAGSGGMVHASSVAGQGTWETTLQGRDLDGNLSTSEAYYDISLNITWLADANYAGTTMDWLTANAWAANLNPYGSGITNWRLPAVTDTGAPGPQCANNGTDCGYNVDTASGEMAHMFYATLGNKGYYDTAGNYPQPGWGLSNTGPFSNVQTHFYWSSMEVPPNTIFRWYFHFDFGGQHDYIYEPFGYYSWAVHAGDVGAAVVPVPAAVWLFGSGVMGLIGVSGKRRR